MGEWQRSLLTDEPERLSPWRVYVMEACRNEPAYGDDADWNGRVRAKVLMKSCPPLASAVRAILQRGEIDGATKETIEFGKKLIASLLTQKNIPGMLNMETLVREVRKAKAELGIELGGSGQSGAASFNEMIQSAEQRSGDYYSDIEAKFGVALKNHFPLLLWQENLDRGSTRPDFICEERKVSIEIDSWEWHRHFDTFQRDRQKSRKYQLEGYKHLQFAAGELSIEGGFRRALSEISKAL